MAANGIVATTANSYEPSAPGMFPPETSYAPPCFVTFLIKYDRLPNFAPRLPKSTALCADHAR